MAGATIALLFLAAIVIIIKFFQIQKAREVENIKIRHFLKTCVRLMIF